MGSLSPSGAVMLHISTDLGKTWNELNLPLPSAAYNDYLVAPEAPTFLNQNDGLMPVQLIKANSDGSYTHNLAFYFTHDGGLNWKASPAVLEKLDRCGIRTAFVSLMNIFVGCRNNLYISKDGAQSWQTSFINPESQNIQAYILQLDFVNSKSGWAILEKENDTTTTSLWKTTDGCQTWAEIKPVIENQ